MDILRDVLLDKYIPIYGKSAKSFIKNMTILGECISEIIIETFFETGIRFSCCNVNENIKMSGYVYGDLSYEKSLVIIHDIADIFSAKGYKIEDWNTRTIIDKKMYDYNDVRFIIYIPRFTIFTDIDIIISRGVY